MTTNDKIFIPDTSKFTEDILQAKQSQLDEDQKVVDSVLSDLGSKFQKLVTAYPNGQQNIAKSPTCKCHKFDQKDALASWSWSHPDMDASGMKQFRKHLDAYQTLLNNNLQTQRYLVFMTCRLVDYDDNGQGNLVQSYFHDVIVSVVLKKEAHIALKNHSTKKS